MTSPVPQVTADDLAAVPEEHRRTIALWLAQRAAGITGAEWILGEIATRAAVDNLNGAAVDLAHAGTDPEDDELSGVHWVNARLAELLTGQ